MVISRKILGRLRIVPGPVGEKPECYLWPMPTPHLCNLVCGIMLSLSHQTWQLGEICGGGEHHCAVVSILASLLAAQVQFPASSKN